MTEVQDLWGNLHNIDDLGALIDKQKEKAAGAIRKGPTPVNEIKSMTVDPDATPEKWFASHQKMVDFIARYTRDIDGIKEAFRQYLNDSSVIMETMLAAVQNCQTAVNVLHVDLENFQNKHNQDVADIIMAVEAAAGEEDAEKQQ